MKADSRFSPTLRPTTIGNCTAHRYGQSPMPANDWTALLPVCRISFRCARGLDGLRLIEMDRVWARCARAGLSEMAADRLPVSCSGRLRLAQRLRACRLRGCVLCSRVNAETPPFRGGVSDTAGE